MSISFKIDYTHYNDDSSPISKDVKVNTSHNKLVAQSENSKKAKKWREENKEKASEIGSMGGNNSKKSSIRKKMSDIGKQYGKENAVKYIPLETKSENGKNYGKYNLTGNIICSKCGKTTNKGNLRFHENNCKERDKIKFIELLPSKFTKSIAKKISEENNIKNWLSLNIFHETCSYTKCVTKIVKPNQFNPNWYIKNIKEINKVISYQTKMKNRG